MSNGATADLAGLYYTSNQRRAQLARIWDEDVANEHHPPQMQYLSTYITPRNMFFSEATGCNFHVPHCLMSQQHLLVSLLTGGLLSISAQNSVGWGMSDAPSSRLASSVSTAKRQSGFLTGESVSQESEEELFVSPFSICVDLNSPEHSIIEAELLYNLIF